MNSDKIELRHIASYLPYGLRWLCLDLDSNEMEDLPLVSIKFSNDELEIGGMDIPIDELPYPNGLTIKPIFKPLSDLTQEQLYTDMWNIGQSSHIDWTTKEREGWIKNYGREKWLNSIPFAIIQYLFENHFDVFGLIDKGLAVDINTI